MEIMTIGKFLESLSEAEKKEIYEKDDRHTSFYEALDNNAIETKNYLQVVKERNVYFAYGEFLDRFRECSKEKMQQLINERPDDESEEDLINVAKLAATIEILCKEYSLSIPTWVMEEQYFLKDDYWTEDVTILEYKQLLKETSPEEFKKRKLYFGDNVMDRY
jgi:hypothetical protein